MDNNITMKKDIAFTINKNFKCFKNGLENWEVIELKKVVIFFWNKN